MSTQKDMRMTTEILRTMLYEKSLGQSNRYLTERICYCVFEGSGGKRRSIEEEFPVYVMWMDVFVRSYKAYVAEHR